MKLSRIDLNLLVALDAVTRTRSVGRAAELVGLSKPAMSHALARLRAQIRDPILVRAGSRWLLTDRAEALAPRVRALVDEASRVLEDGTNFSPSSLAREFRIHATDHVLAILGLAVGHAVSREAPAAALRFLPILPDDAGALRQGDVDLAIGVFPELPGEFRTQRVFVDRYVCVVRKGHPKLRGRLTMERYLELAHVLVAPRGRAGGVVDEALAAKGLRRRVVRFVPYFLTALALVADSDCAVTTSERLALAYARRFGLKVLGLPLSLPHPAVSQVWHPRVDTDAAHVWLRKLVATVARTSLPDLGPK